MGSFSSWLNQNNIARGIVVDGVAVTEPGAQTPPCEKKSIGEAILFGIINSLGIGEAIETGIRESNFAQGISNGIEKGIQAGIENLFEAHRARKEAEAAAAAAAAQIQSMVVKQGVAAAGDDDDSPSTQTAQSVVIKQGVAAAGDDDSPSTRPVRL